MIGDRTLHLRRKTSSPAPRLVTSAMALVCASGCGGSQPSVRHAEPHRDRALDDGGFASTIRFRGSSDCSGVLIAPSWVLTAAHCVAGVTTLPSVIASGPRETYARDIDDCRMHPGAFAGATRCLEERSPAAIEAVAPAHDLGLVHLAQPFAAGEIVPIRWVSQRPASLVNARVRVMSWLPSEFSGDALHRVTGWNEVTSDDGVLVTRPVMVNGADRVSTQPGDSGSPALFATSETTVVLGVLSGGSAPYAVDSVFAETFEPENAAWIAEVVR